MEHFWVDRKDQPVRCPGMAAVAPRFAWAAAVCRLDSAISYHMAL
jgi:hypothetical protein